MCPKCSHHTWHVDRSVHEESNDHNKMCNAGALRAIKVFLLLQGVPDAPWHYRRRRCRKCRHTQAFVELPLSVMMERSQLASNRENNDA